MLTVQFVATIVAILLAAPFVVLTAAFTLEVATGLAGVRRHAAAGGVADAALPAVTIVMPANDEAAIITATLAQLNAALPATFRVLLVADNCTDDTAALAEAGGASVIRRDDPVRRGKGYALAAARDHLIAAPPEVVIVLDADCTTDRASLETLARLGATQVTQAAYLLRPDLAAPPMVQVSNFAFVIKNLVRQAGLERLARRVNLTGTGMAFPWAVFRDAPLATADIVEDLALGLDLAARGTPPHFAAQATIWSAASSAEGTARQRTRWEGGFLATSLRHALPTIAHAVRRGDRHALWAGTSLAIPPLTLLLLLDGAAIVVLAALALAGASPWPAVVLAAALLAALLVLVTAWRQLGRPFLSAGAAARLPLYIAWKIPLYLRLLTGRPTAWLRPGR